MVVRMSRITLRCKKDCNGLLKVENKHIDHSKNTATTWYGCIVCGREFKVESVYDAYYDDMILTSSMQINDTHIEVSIDERAKARLAKAQEV